ncbi:DUF2894 domain-containing protein [Variovorax paradoxus]|nr:DUF2894 domain-containing protein [Variovorax paradoxus]WGT66622.1 DUF2894 domain-containing protein [Variovorax paradoxus]
MIGAWRAQGQHRADPVRFHFMEALARRTAAHQGEARRILDEKLAGLAAAYGRNLEKAQGVDSAVKRLPAGAPARGALAELVDHIAQHAPAIGGSTAAAAEDTLHGLAPAPAELKSLKFFKSTWSRLSAERRLTQSLAKVPENAGPLNSHHLVHRSLLLMRDLSPEYLNRFMTYVDTLLWVDQLNGAGAAAPVNAPRAETSKKSARGKSA